MQIHELPQLTRTPVDADVVAIDSGSSTYKLSLAETISGAIDDTVPAMIEEAKILVIRVPEFSDLPLIVEDENITGDMTVVSAEIGTRTAQTGDWTVVTAAGSLEISGPISESTTLTLYLLPTRDGSNVSVIQGEDKKSLVLRKSYTYTNDTALAAGATKQITGNDFGFMIPQGYSILAARGIYVSGTTALAISGMRLGVGNGQAIAVKNVSQSSVTNFTVTLSLSFIKSEYCTDQL